jgi:glycosyltransferase involved in cell wall biosynthesis
MSSTVHCNTSATWIVVPAYNEEPAIASVLADLQSLTHHVVVVDDGSSDATANVAVAADGRVVVLRHPINLGQGAALQTGITFAISCGAEFIVTFDADAQHCACDVERLLEALAVHNADYALGSRFLGQTVEMPASRRYLLTAATWFTRATSGLALTDAHNGLRAMTRRGAMLLNLRQNRMAHASEILDQIAQSGLKYVEVPVTVRYSTYSRSKGQRTSEALDILLDLYSRRLHQ